MGRSAAGGVITIVLTPIVMGSGTSRTPAVLMLALLVMTLLLALVVGESFRARGAR